MPNSRAPRDTEHRGLFGVNGVRVFSRRGSVKDKRVVLHKNSRYLRNGGQGCRERRVSGITDSPIGQCAPISPWHSPTLVRSLSAGKEEEEEKTARARRARDTIDIDWRSWLAVSNHDTLRDHCGLTSRCFAAANIAKLRICVRDFRAVYFRRGSKRWGWISRMVGSHLFYSNRPVPKLRRGYRETARATPRDEY